MPLGLIRRLFSLNLFWPRSRLAVLPPTATLDSVPSQVATAGGAEGAPHFRCAPGLLSTMIIIAQCATRRRARRCGDAEEREKVLKGR